MDSRLTPSPEDTAALRGLKHAIGWCDLTFNYGIYGCQMVSPACGTSDGSSMCYASKTAERLTAFAHGGGPYAGLVEDGRWTGEVRVDPDRISAAFATLPKRPRRDGRPWRVFGSMFDLFHKDVPFEFIAIVYGAMAARPWINFQILTKRADRMAEFYRWLGRNGQDEWETVINAADAHDGDGHEPALLGGGLYVGQWPIPNIWAGVTVEDQRRADERVPWLLQVPAAVRFLSVEPMLGAIDLSEWTERIDFCNDCGAENEAQGPDKCPACGASGTLISTWGHAQADRYRTGERYDENSVEGRADVAGTARTIDWVIVGSESDGPRPGARETRDEWVIDLVGQCDAASVPVFFKQLAIGGRLCSLPMLDRRVRAEFPESAGAGGVSGGGP